MKETFFFSHDYNARSDTKIKKLLAKHGMTGYGIFWALVEDLYNNANALQTDYEVIAYDLRVDCELVKSIINDFDLFQVDDVNISSKSVEERLSKRNEKSIKASESARARWGDKKKDANAMRTHSDSNAIKDNKVKDNKINNNVDLVADEIGSKQDDFELSFDHLGVATCQKLRQTCIDYRKDHLGVYADEMYAAFIKYWSEPNEKKVPRWYTEKNKKGGRWNLPGRLSTWAKNNTVGFVKPIQQATTILPDSYKLRKV